MQGAAMRHITRLAATGLATAVALGACGSGTNILHGKSAKQIVQLASSSVDNGSYHMTLHGVISIDTSGVTGVPAAAMDQFAALLKGATFDGVAEVQNPKRMKVTMTMKPLTDKQVVMVLYDGSTFVSMDGGKTYADAGSFDFKGLPLAPSDQVALLQQTADSVQDQGTTTRNGVSVEHLHAVLGQDYVNKVLGQAGSGQSDPQMQQVMQLFSQVMSIRNASADAYVGTADGYLRGEDVHATIAMDMGKLIRVLSQAFGGSLPGSEDASSVGGAMVMSEAVTTNYSDYGSRITVTKPTVDPKAPSLPGGGGLFGA
jgi:hypothetical protein